MLLLSQSHFLHCKNVRGVSSHPLAAVPVQHAQAKGSWGGLTATFCLFKNIGVFRYLSEILNRKFQQNPPLLFLFLNAHTSASSQTAEPLCSWEDFFSERKYFLPA